MGEQEELVLQLRQEIPLIVRMPSWLRSAVVLFDPERLRGEAGVGQDEYDASGDLADVEQLFQEEPLSQFAPLLTGEPVILHGLDFHRHAVQEPLVQEHRQSIRDEQPQFKHLGGELPFLELAERL